MTAIGADFCWAEVGARIRDRRFQCGMSQQALAAAAGITQNGVFRLEAGETNPQLSTLQQIAGALGCSVRDLIVGATSEEPVLAERFQRVKRVIESGDDVALRVLDSGIESAEALLERSSGRRGLPPIKVKGEGRRSPADDLFWMRTSPRIRSEVDEGVVSKVVQKAHEPFGNSVTRHETKNKHK